RSGSYSKLSRKRASQARPHKSEMTAYRAPFLAREGRLPTLVWPRQIPIEGEPADVTQIVKQYGKAMSQSALPKLLIVVEPGGSIRGRILDSRRTWPKR